ncbi:endochitinase A1-like isoform X2 [Lytechinus variegatus]|uniref:endochitinase A1-like isoform X2 n=1 Tax=Lytechinus variegatus TaxID=7654 RepID=UPI001BB28D82|nr:endochitinase A1-like isoform X2 [Lytechinus variegatus]
MRDRKLPDDEYNRRLHIYAETPGLQQPVLVPASEKELNAPRPPPSSALPAQGHSSIQTHPYARIPAANFVEEEEEDVDLPSSTPVTGQSSSSASSIISPGTSRSNGLTNGKTVGQGRDPIYAELDHRHSEDDRTENASEGITKNKAASIHSSTPLRTSDVILNPSESTSDGRSRTVSPQPLSKRQAPLPGSSIAKKLDLTQGSGPHSKTIRTHTRLDASLEIPATPRPKYSGTEKKDDNGILLIRKTEHSSEVKETTTSSTKNENDGVVTRPNGSGGSGITLTRVRSIDGQPTMALREGDGEGEAQIAMPVDPEFDAGMAVIKKKQRFRRNMIFIISFLMILLIVVAAVIISLVIVTKNR